MYNSKSGLNRGYYSYLQPMLGGLAQLVERLLCKQDVSGSSPLTSIGSDSQVVVRLKRLPIVHCSGG